MYELQNTQVFILDITLVDVDVLTVFEKKVSKDRLEISKKFRFYNDRCRCICVEIVLRYALNTIGSFTNPEFSHNRFGKPYLKNMESIKFNMTHSGRYVAVALSEQEVGIDIEQVQSGLRGTVDMFFSEVEKQYVNNLEVKKLNEQMIRIWTMKESYSKYIGKGLSIDFSKFTVLPSSYEVLDELGKTLDGYIFNKKLDEKYYIAICSKKKEVQINTVNLKDLINTIGRV